MAELRLSSLHFKSFQMTQGIFYSNFPGHAHARNNYEIHYVIDGRGEVITNEKSYRLTKNTIYVTGPHQYHMQKTNSEKNMQEYCLFFELDTSTDDFFLNVFQSRNFWIGKSNPRIKKLFQEIFTLLQAKTMYYDTQAAYLILLLILEFAQLYDPQIVQLANNPDNIVNNETLTTDWFFLYNLSNLSLQSLSEALGLSQRQTQRMLQKNYGKSFQKKKREAQLERAKILLSNGTAPLSEIADECGFYSSAALCNFFKKHMGMTPTQYRHGDTH